ncbi:MAG: hypothetical protein Q8O40_13495 [Chloroflexota bacterium]|nr:hypothetical protein [Chloroflexota bacterium]
MKALLFLVVFALLTFVGCGPAATPTATPRPTPTPTPVCLSANTEVVDVVYSFLRDNLKSTTVKYLQEGRQYIRAYCQGGGTWEVMALGYADGKIYYNEGRWRFQERTRTIVAVDDKAKYVERQWFIR